MSHARPENNQNPAIDPLALLPKDVVATHIYPHLGMGDLNRASLVSKRWYQLFSQHCQWELIIARDFNIPLPTLYKFRRELLAIEPTMEGVFIAIYQHLRILMQNIIHPHYTYPPRELNDTFNPHLLHPTNHLALLACCANIHRGQKVMRHFIPADEQEAWMWLSIYANAEASVDYFLSQSPGCLGLRTYPNSILETTALLGLMDLLKMLLNKRKYHLQATPQLFEAALLSGNAELYHYLCRSLPHIAKPSLRTLQACAAESGSLAMLKHICNVSSLNNTYLTPDTIMRALFSGNVELICHLFFAKNIPATTLRLRLEAIDYVPAHPLNNNTQQLITANEQFFKLRPCMKTLHEAAHCGNLASLQSLLEMDTTLLEHDMHITLSYAACSGNLALMRYLLDPANAFDLEPDMETFSSAIVGGNLEVIQLLLDPSREYDIRPDIDSLYDAASYGRLAILYYLLDPNHGFDLAFSSRDDEHPESMISSVCQPLVLCSEAVNDFFHYLRENNIPVALEHLHSADATQSIRHFVRMMIHAITYPDRYPLETLGTGPLYTALKAAVLRQHTLLERKQINDMLANSTLASLRELADAQNIAMDIEPEQKRMRY